MKKGLAICKHKCEQAIRAYLTFKEKDTANLCCTFYQSIHNSRCSTTDPNSETFIPHITEGASAVVKERGLVFKQWEKQSNA